MKNNIYCRYDIFLQQQLDAYDAYRFESSAPLAEYNYLIVGPGGHCAAGQFYPAYYLLQFLILLLFYN